MTRFRPFVHLILFSALAGIANLALAQQEAGRVLSSSPIRAADGSTSYSVTYEYAGRQYTTRTDTPPGATIPVQISAVGMTQSTPVRAPTQAPATTQMPSASAAQNAPWDNAPIEQGVVVSSGGVQPPLPAYTTTVVSAPVYAAPVVAYPPPYPYYYPYVYPPIGLSLNFGYVYSRGGYYGYRGYRGWH